MLGPGDICRHGWGPNSVTLAKRYFKQKDIVENYLAAEVRAGRMGLAEAQEGIAADWTQYLEAARMVIPHS